MRFRVLPFLGFLLFISYNLFAQPGGGGPCPNPPCNQPVPIGGIEFLIASGLMLGARYLFKKQK